MKRIRIENSIQMKRIRIKNIQVKRKRIKNIPFTARSLVVSDLRSETKHYRFEVRLETRHCRLKYVQR